MSDLVRFGVSIEKKLLDKFDALIEEKRYQNRSEALRDLIRENLVSKEWVAGKEVAGTISLVYDHHQRELLNKLIDIQHDFQKYIVSSQHIHLDHYNCLEIIVVKGSPVKIKNLKDSLTAIKGVKHSVLSMTSLGKEL